MDGDVKRAEVLFYYPLLIAPCHAAESDIIPIQKGHTVILIFYIQGLAHSFGQLQNKAEDAPIATLLQIERLQYDPKLRRPALCLNRNKHRLITSRHEQIEFRLVTVIHQVDAVANPACIYRNKAVAGPESRPCRFTFLQDRFY